MPTLDELIEEIKVKHGFSDEAWAIFKEAINLSEEMAHRVEQLEKKVKTLEYWSGRCQCPHCVVIG